MNGFRKINKHTANEIERHLDIAGTSLNTFRYYKTRSIHSVQQHLVTYLYYQDNIPVAYGHLDKEDEIVWLGISVAEQYIGKGYGNKMMEELMRFAKENGIQSICLSVDKENTNAVKLYEKFGFLPFKQTEKILYYQNNRL